MIERLRRVFYFESSVHFLETNIIFFSFLINLFDFFKYDWPLCHLQAFSHGIVFVTIINFFLGSNHKFWALIRVQDFIIWFGLSLCWIKQVWLIKRLVDWSYMLKGSYFIYLRRSLRIGFRFFLLFFTLTFASVYHFLLLFLWTIFVYLWFTGFDWRIKDMRLSRLRSSLALRLLWKCLIVRLITFINFRRG